MKDHRRQLDFLLSSDWSELPSHPSVLSTRGLLHPAAHQAPAKAEPLSDKVAFLLFLSVSLLFSPVSLLLPKRPDGVLVKFSSSATLRGLCLVPKLHLIESEGSETTTVTGNLGTFLFFFACFLCCFFLTSRHAGVHKKGAFSRRRSCFPSKSTPVAPQPLFFFACIFYFYLDITDSLPR